MPEHSNVGRSSLVRTSPFSFPTLPCAVMQGASCVHAHAHTHTGIPACMSIPRKQLLLFHSWGPRMCLLASSALSEADEGRSRGVGACLGRRYWFHGLEGAMAGALGGHVLLALQSCLCGRHPTMGGSRTCVSWAGALAKHLSAVFQVKELKMSPPPTLLELTKDRKNIWSPSPSSRPGGLTSQWGI